MSPCLVVIGDDSCWEVVGLNPGRLYWMEFFSDWFVVNFVLFAWKDQKQMKKKPGLAHFFKKIFSFVGSISKHLQIKKILNDQKRCWGWSTSKELKGGGCLWTKEQCQVHTLLLPCPFEDSKNCIGFCYIGKSNGIVITSPI